MTKNKSVKAPVPEFPSPSVVGPAGEQPGGNGSLRAEHRVRLLEPPASSGREEALVIDDRAHLRPAQVVESKLTRLLQEASVPVSHLQMRGLLRAR
jgi:hypothetical protein